MAALKKDFSILLADDDKDDRFFFKEAFREVDPEVEIVTVIDGEELTIFFLHPQLKLPDLVFLDLNLPKKNGIECLTDIRRKADMSDLIVAIYSTSSSERDIAETFSKGANLYIKKPNDYFSLIKILKQVMRINWQEHNAMLTKDSFLFLLKEEE